MIRIQLNKFISPEEEGFAKVPENYVYKKVDYIVTQAFGNMTHGGVTDFGMEEIAFMVGTLLADSNLRGQLAVENQLPGTKVEVPDMPNKVLTTKDFKGIDKVRDNYPSIQEPRSSWEVWKDRIIEKSRTIAQSTSNFLLPLVYKTVGKSIASGMTNNEAFKSLQKMNIPGAYIDQVINKNIIDSFNAGRVSQADLYDYIGGWQIVTMRDSRVRPSHRKLHGMMAPKDHEVWLVYFPPYGYGCRCVVIAIPHDKVKTIGVDTLPMPPEYERDSIGPDYPWFGQNPGGYYGFK